MNFKDEVPFEAFIRILVCLLGLVSDESNELDLKTSSFFLNWLMVLKLNIKKL